MAEFVQIGKCVFNPNLITEMWLYEEHVVIYFGSDTEPITFYDENHAAFMDWWERKANVDVVKADA